MVNLEEKRPILEELIRNLSLLVAMLNLEPRPEQRYAHHVEPYLQEAKRLADEGFTFEELKEKPSSLSSSPSGSRASCRRSRSTR